MSTQIAMEPRASYDHAICAACGGECCRRMAGACSPADIARLFPAADLRSSVLLALRSGRYAVDWWEAEPLIPFVRAAVKGHEGRLHHPAWAGECTFFNGGCELSDDDRPHQCRILRPRENGECEMPPGYESKLAYAEMWGATGIDLMEIGLDLSGASSDE